jgi:DNA (cytosine-5)-methyltransferase 1
MLAEREYTPLPSGLIVPTDVARRKLTRPIALDAFCGCGGMSLGIIQGGFEVLAGIEWEPAAAVTYMMNLCNYPCQIHFVDKDAERILEKHLSRSYKKATKKGKLETGFPVAGSGWLSHNRWAPPVRNFIFGDITKIAGKDICRWLGISRGELDLLTGSPPCQGFSMAGKRDINDARNDLTLDFARLAIELYPRSICMENVSSMLTMVNPEGRSIMDEFVEVLETGDFNRGDTLRKVLRNRFGSDIVLGRGPVKAERAKRNKEALEEDEAVEAEQMELL